MLCNDFENRLTDYLDGALAPADNKMFAEHALRCPICHDTLSAVKNSVQACRSAANLELPRELEARILLSTMPETAMSCEEFEDFLTDYLDGFLPASLFHRWERHAILCARCTELPGEVVRAIGTVNVYRGDELPVPAGLNQRILLATMDDKELALEIRASFGERVASWLRAWLDPIISPQLATVATMLLVAVFVLTNTVSADGSISGVYDASLRLAERSAGSNGVKDITKGLKQLVGGQEKNQSAEPKPQPKQNAAPNRGGRNRS